MKVTVLLKIFQKIIDHLPATYWGFPIEERRKKSSDETKTSNGKKTKKEQGISILIAIMTIAMMISFVSEMIVTSTVSVELAVMSRDKIKSEYLAKSGFNLALYVLSASYLWDHMQASGTMGPKTEPKDGPDSLWNMVKNWPPLGAGNSPLLEIAAKSEDDPFGLQGFMNEDVLGQMNLFEDSFSIKIHDENSKINISDCQFRGANACQEVLAQLEALFSCPTEKAFLESKEIEPTELAYRIRDFITDREEADSKSNIGSKDGPYSKKDPPYKAKRLPFDTLEELKLIEGWDDDLHAVFSPYLTVYPYSYKKTQHKQEKRFGININTAPKELLTCFFPESQDPNCREKSIQQLHTAEQEGESLLISDKKQDILKKLNELFCYTPDADSEQAGLPPEDWFITHSKVFRIEIDAETGHQRRKLEVVIRRIDAAVNEPIIKKREVKRSYQILYWKLV